MAVMWRRGRPGRPVAVVDVGSNTVRLLVVRDGRPVLSEREMLRLGADVERDGTISDRKITLTTKVVRRFAEDARRAGVERLEVLITSPGRQASNGEALVELLTVAARAPARVLSASEEGRLAFVGAVEITQPPPRREVAVVDVGGGSAQIVVGTRRDGVRWQRSIDLGSQRLTSRLLSTDPPGVAAIDAARAEVAAYLDGVAPPPHRTGYAVGGSARALKRIVGSRLGASELAYVLDLVAAVPARELGQRYAIGDERTRTLAAGAVLVSVFQELLGGTLKVVRGGLRDGAAAELTRRRAAA
jgi:exopolyphosphatase/guanosine-5'-triphosphate,3'-diphosphate pyrophosphatase